MSPLEDRAYQWRAVEMTMDAWSDGAKNACLSMPTGTGKTATAARLVHAAKAELGTRSAFITDRVSLFPQTRATMESAGLRTATIQGDRTSTPGEVAAADVVLCSAQTLDARGIMPDDLDVHMGIIDECHTEREISRRWLSSPICMAGLTATPLARWMTEELAVTGEPPWHQLVQPMTTRDAINAGILLEPLFRADIPDPTEAAPETPTGAGGDWSEEQAERIMSPYLGAIVETWQRVIAMHEKDGGFGGYLAPTIVQAASIAQAEDLAERFTLETGEQWSAITSRVDQDTSERLVEDFNAGELQGVVSVQKLTIGFDAPNAALLVSARPTNRILTWVQLVGRVMRQPQPGNLARAVVLDCAGNGHRHAGRLHRFWSNGATWPLGARATPEAGGPASMPEPGAVQPCPDHPTIVQPPGSQVCVVCYQPLKPVEKPAAVKVWKDAIEADELGRSILALARARLQKGDTQERVQAWARVQVHGLTGRWPAPAWPGPLAVDPFAKERPHPVVAKMIKRNIALWHEWSLDDPQDRPPEPPVERIALAGGAA